MASLQRSETRDLGLKPFWGRAFSASAPLGALPKLLVRRQFPRGVVRRCAGAGDRCRDRRFLDQPRRFGHQSRRLDSDGVRRHHCARIGHRADGTSLHQ